MKQWIPGLVRMQNQQMKHHSLYPKNIKLEKEYFFLSNVAQQGMSMTRSTTLEL